MQSVVAFEIDAFRDSCYARDEARIMVAGPVIAVIDDEESVREALPGLLAEFGFSACVFASAEEFLASGDIDRIQCLILDIAMPGMSGPDLHRELKALQKEIPIIFITAHGDEEVRQRLLQQGAVECLLKPFSDTELLDALNAALGER